MMLNVSKQNYTDFNIITLLPALKYSPPSDKIHEVENILADSAIGVWALNNSAPLIQASETFSKLLQLNTKAGYTFQELFNVIDLSCRTNVMHEIKKACNSENSFTIEFKACKLSGTKTKWFRINGRIHSIPGETQRSYTGTLIEITQEKNIQTWNNDRLALMSHELKGPLSVIKLYLQRAEKMFIENNISDAALMLRKADDQVGLMTSLMDDFLCCSANDNNIVRLNYEWFDLATLVEDKVAELKLNNTGHRFKINVPSTVNVKADKRKITQVITNYITNAIKYSPAKSCIRIKCCIENGMVKLSVTDNGIGIDTPYLPKVFNRYFRTPGTTAAGYGLGLYLVREIIHQHGGSVGVESRLNEGSTFYFLLPLSINTPKS